MGKLTSSGKAIRSSRAHVQSIAVAVVLTFAALLVGGCASIDPTDPSHFVDVQVHNDKSSPVQLIQCDTSCDTLHDRQTIPAGASTTVNVSNEGIEVGYLVENLANKELGCIYMLHEHVQHPPVVAVSSMTQCR